MAKQGGDIVEMIIELFLIGSVGVAGLVYLVTANMTGLDATIVALLSTVIPTFFAIMIVYRWYKRIK
jgi:membrane protein YdbS with pleckstrin-like domain